MFTDTIVTHDGKFHADDVIGVAVLSTLFPTYTLVRTRDPEVINAAHFAVDVGGISDPKSGRFDHHQRGGAGLRDNGVPYASAGLVWKQFGHAFISKVLPRDMLRYSDSEDPFHGVDRRVIQFVDGIDCGKIDVHAHLNGEDPEDSSVIVPHLSGLLGALNQHPDFGPMSADEQLSRFQVAVNLAQQLLLGEVQHQISIVMWKDLVDHADLEGPILVLNRPCADVGAGWTRWVAQKAHVKFVVFPSAEKKGEWRVRGAPVSASGFQSRVLLPEMLAGHRGSELDCILRKKDGIFVHRDRWIGGARSKESCIQLAQLGLEAAAQPRVS